MIYNDKPIEYLAEYPNALPPGTKLKNGAYKVMNVLGQGSFGITYLAVTPEDQLFAIKEYFHKTYCERSTDNSMSYSSNAEGAQEVIDGFKNFTNEAANLTRIYSENHRRFETARSQQRHDLLAEENYNIVRVVENFEENKTSYLVMEYLDGGNLQQKLNKPMSEEQAVSIIIPIAWAVQHLHDNHIMHKDIKPENIMMRSGNLLEPKLIDFGTTLHYDRSGKLTTRSIGAALGTDNYCSLEHSATSRLTPHLDVYSLGATLFHMVTGSPRDPWGDRPQPNVVMEHLKGSLAKANVSERVRMAILQAMDNNPNKRTQTAREFIENLNSPYLPLGTVLESPNGNRYRIISVGGQEKDYLSYKAERLLKDAPIVNGGTALIDKINDGYIYSVHENFERGLCRRDENQCVTSNRGHWPKQDYLAHVKEHVGLVKIPSISVDKQGNPLSEMFTANGTIYSVKRKKSGLSGLFSNNRPANSQQIQIKRNWIRKRMMRFVAIVVGTITLSIMAAIIPYNNRYSENDEEILGTSLEDSIVIEINRARLTMIGIEGGRFTMGSKDRGDYPAGPEGEKPPVLTQEVTLLDFYISKYEVTQELWEAVMGSNPSKWVGKEKPVHNISWEDCQVFLNKLYTLTKKKFRLPTEAEWEFAARGGNKSRGYKYSGSNYIDDVAWWGGNAGEYKRSAHSKVYGPQPVGTKRKNELGLYDMTGNVREWCQDWFDSNYSTIAQTDPQGPKTGVLKVCRGGSWLDEVGFEVVSRLDWPPTRISGSDYYDSDDLYILNGFRLVIDADEVLIKNQPSDSQTN